MISMSYLNHVKLMSIPILPGEAMFFPQRHGKATTPEIQFSQSSSCSRAPRESSRWAKSSGELGWGWSDDKPTMVRVV